MQSSFQRFLFDLLKLGAIILFIVVPLRVYVAQPFLVSGASMAPTFQTGEYLIVDQASYYFGDPQRGDVVIFRFPYNPDTFFIKRVIGLPGETVQITNGVVTIRNDQYPDGTTLDEPYVENANGSPVTETTSLGPNEYFVLGDNRNSSSDSRAWGPLPERYIVGRALIRLLPVSELDVLPGAVELAAGARDNTNQ